MPDPLEQFLTEYVNAVGGLAEEIEPQVYDVLLPDEARTLRLAFDPDALPEHPSAQLLTFGSALLDRLLVQAQARGRSALAYLDDAHLAVHALDQRVRRDFILPPGTLLQLEAARPLYVTTTVFWFETTFMSDEREQSLYPIAVDHYYGRLVRYLEPLLAGERLSEIRRYPYPDAPSLPLDQAYHLAGERVARTVTAEANSRQQELLARQAQQRTRMTRYFADLRAELNERLDKVQAPATFDEPRMRVPGRARGALNPAHGRTQDSAKRRTRGQARAEETDDASRRTRGAMGTMPLDGTERHRQDVSRVDPSDSLRSRLEALDREENLRLEELQRKTILRVQIKLMNLLHIKTPRLFLNVRLVPDDARRAPIPLNVTWDPLLEKADAVDCPNCQHPTYEFRVGGRGELRCPNCGPA